MSWLIQRVGCCGQFGSNSLRLSTPGMIFTGPESLSSVHSADQPPTLLIRHVKSEQRMLPFSSQTSVLTRVAEAFRGKSSPSFSHREKVANGRMRESSFMVQQHSLIRPCGPPSPGGRRDNLDHAQRASLSHPGLPCDCGAPKSAPRTPGEGINFTRPDQSSAALQWARSANQLW